MSDVKKLKIGSTVYDIVDATAAHSLGDVAVAGDNITFTSPILVEHFSKTGSPSISSLGIFTPSNSNYISASSSNIPNYTNSIYTGSYDWSWTVKFKSPSNVSQSSYIFSVGSANNSPSMCAGYLSYSGTSAGSVSFRVYIANSWVTINGGAEATILQPSTYYYMRCSRDTTNGLYKLELSTDGATWNTEATYASNDNASGSSSTLWVSFVNGAYPALEFDLTGLKFTTNYSGVSDWVAFEVLNKNRIDCTFSIPSSYLQNSATQQGSVNVLGSSITSYGTNFGISTQSSNYGCSFGYYAQGGSYSVALGGYSKASSYSVAIGAGSSNNNSARADNYAVSIGDYCSSGQYGVAIGYTASANERSLALGNEAKTTAKWCVQLGTGTNSTQSTLSFGTNYNNSWVNYTLVNADGTIPTARMPSAVLQNTATGTNGLSLIGTASSSNNAVNIGYGSQASSTGATAYGMNAKANGYVSTALGCSAVASASGSLQIGPGTNSTANTLSVGLSTTDNYILLNSDGTIPGARMSLSGASAPDTSTVGSVGQFYVDTTNQDAYICVSDASSTYTWKKITA